MRKNLTNLSLSLRTANKIQLSPEEVKAVESERKTEQRKAMEAQYVKRAKERVLREEEILSRKVPIDSGDTMVEIEDTTDGNTSNSPSGSNFTRNEILKRNKMDISHTSCASIRFGVSYRATAAIVTVHYKGIIRGSI